jgi:hypothetical protein
VSGAVRASALYMEGKWTTSGRTDRLFYYYTHAVNINNFE